MERVTLPPSDAPTTPTLRQQIDNLPAHIVGTWRSHYANEGTGLEARAIIDREAATIRAAGQMADALAIWMRLADAAGKIREPPPLPGWQAAYACRGLKRLAATPLRSDALLT